LKLSTAAFTRTCSSTTSGVTRSPSCSTWPLTIRMRFAGTGEYIEPPTLIGGSWRRMSSGSSVIA